MVAAASSWIPLLRSPSYYRIPADQASMSLSSGMPGGGSIVGRGVVGKDVTSQLLHWWLLV